MFRLKRKLQMLFQVAEPAKSLLFNIMCIRNDLEGKALIKVVIVRTVCHEVPFATSVWPRLQHLGKVILAYDCPSARNVCQSQISLTLDT
jgi:hypothetical protein